MSDVRQQTQMDIDIFQMSQLTETISQMLILLHSQHLSTSTPLLRTLGVQDRSLALSTATITQLNSQYL